MKKPVQIRLIGQEIGRWDRSGISYMWIRYNNIIMMPVEFPFVLMKHAFFLDKYFLFVSIYLLHHIFGLSILKGTGLLLRWVLESARMKLVCMSRFVPKCEISPLALFILNWITFNVNIPVITAFWVPYILFVLSKGIIYWKVCQSYQFFC